MTTQLNKIPEYTRITTINERIFLGIFSIIGLKTKQNTQRQQEMKKIFF